MDPVLKLVAFSRALDVTVFNWEANTCVTTSIENEENSLEQAIQIPSLETAIDMAQQNESLRVYLVGFCNFASPLASPGTSRAFVSAMSLGPEGKRGVWAERDRGSTRRNIVVFDASCFPYNATADSGQTPEAAFEDGLPLGDLGDRRIIPVLKGQSIYNNASYDLRGRCHNISEMAD
ncbi:hypothetical protein HWV62_19663 [Athelia sp. TMB]|nr:hypothetical protein HWV62_19663 [Athelia sp. TMB]